MKLLLKTSVLKIVLVFQLLLVNRTSRHPVCILTGDNLNLHSALCNWNVCCWFYAGWWKLENTTVNKYEVKIKVCSKTPIYVNSCFFCLALWLPPSACFLFSSSGNRCLRGLNFNWFMAVSGVLSINFGLFLIFELNRNPCIPNLYQVHMCWRLGNCKTINTVISILNFFCPFHYTWKISTENGRDFW